MNKIRLSCIFVVFISAVGSAQAQQRPFLYSVSIPQSQIHGLVLHLDTGWGSGSLGSPEATFIDRRFGAVWRANSNWTLLAHAGFGENSASQTAFSAQAEVFYALKHAINRGFSVDVGGGMRWESEEGAVALLHAISGWKSDSWLLESNLVLEKASSPDRDPLDVIVSAGWLYRISPSISVGVEAVGQDLEGFWRAEEAEGGARILSGPSIHFNFDRWEAGVAGGYVFRPTNSLHRSSADRAFGSDRIAIQFSLSRSF